MGFWVKTTAAAFLGTLVLFLAELVERASPTVSETGFIDLGGPRSVTHLLLASGYYLAVGGTIVALLALVRQGATSGRLGLSVLPGLAAVLLVYAFWPQLTAVRYGGHTWDYPQRPLPFAPVSTEGVQDPALVALVDSIVSEPQPVTFRRPPTRGAALAKEVVGGRLGVELAVSRQDPGAIYLTAVAPVDNLRVEVVVTPSARALADLEGGYQVSPRCAYHRQSGRVVVSLTEVDCSPISIEWTRSAWAAADALSERVGYVQAG